MNIPNYELITDEPYPTLPYSLHLYDSTYIRHVYMLYVISGLHLLNPVNERDQCATIVR